MSQKLLFAELPGREKFNLADPDNLYKAVWAVLARYQEANLKPGAEHWQADTRYARPALVADIRAEWLTIIGADELFPWHDDFVVYAWVSLRKCNNAAKREACEALGITVPKKWQEPEQQD